MYVQYQPNENDKPILENIIGRIRGSLNQWYGAGARLDADYPEICSYRNSFILRYPVTTARSQKKHILVKIRRNPKMTSLTQAIQANIHQQMEFEYKALKFLHDRLTYTRESFGAIRPLLYITDYPAIVMEEYPSRSMRQLLMEQRSSKTDWAASELKDAARKTGRWLYFFHQQLYLPLTKPYTTSDILLEVQAYADRIEQYSRGRVRAQSLLDAFSKKLENIYIDQMTFSHSHSDMTTDNVLYSNDRKVCIIDIKNRVKPVYVDLGLILTHPETSKPQIFSFGRYYSESLLRRYRAEIVAGYFDHQPGNETLIRIYSAIQVLNKWLMYEELMSRYKGIKRLLTIPMAPYVSAYFKRLLKKHLELIEETRSYQAYGVETTTKTSV